MKLIKRSFIVLIAIVAIIGVSGCMTVDANGKSQHNGKNTITPSGKIATKDYNLGTISSINLTSLPDIVITQGSRQKVTVKASDNILQYCQLKNNDGKLTISLTKDGDTKNFKGFDMVIYITVKDIKSVRSTGTGDVKFQGSINVESLDLSTSGTGDIQLPMFSCGTIKVNITGTGDVSVNGKANFANLSISGTGDINAKINGLDKITASISGTGDMSIKGSTEYAKYSVAGTGDIYARNMIAKYVKAAANGVGDITCYASESFSGSRNDLTNITCYGKPKNRNFNADGYSFP